MIEFKNVSFSYDKNIVINNVSFKINKGGIFGIIGPNGSGKTTLFKLMTGYLKRKSGEILIDGISIDNIDRKKFANIAGVIKQDNSVFFPYSVKETILSGRYSHKIKYYSKYDFEIINNIMNKLGIEYLKDKKITKISGGEKQLVFLARAFSAGEKIILMDEPTSNLDIGHLVKMLSFIKKNTENKTIVFISHDINVIFRICNEVLVLNNGEKIFQGTPQEIVENKILEKVYCTNFIYSQINNKIITFPKI